MIASLPMYWRAQTAPHWQAFWREVQADVDLPDLTAPEDLPVDLYEHWLDPKLALSMTCGLPFRGKLRGQVTYVGTLDFGLPLEIGHYNSVVISKTARLKKDPRLAFNSTDSQSGWAVTQAAAPFSKPPRFAAVLETGSHAASLEAVATEKADVAYIDAVTWRLLKLYDPLARGIHVLGTTEATPGLPFITAKGQDPEPLRKALRQAVKTFSLENPYAIGGPLDFTVLNESAYLDMPLPSDRP